MENETHPIQNALLRLALAEGEINTLVLNGSIKKSKQGHNYTYYGEEDLSRCRNIMMAYDLVPFMRVTGDATAWCKTCEINDVASGKCVKLSTYSATKHFDEDGVKQKMTAPQKAIGTDTYCNRYVNLALYNIPKEDLREVVEQDRKRKKQIDAFINDYPIDAERMQALKTLSMMSRFKEMYTAINKELNANRITRSGKSNRGEFFSMFDLEMCNRIGLFCGFITNVTTEDGQRVAFMTDVFNEQQGRINCSSTPAYAGKTLSNALYVQDEGANITYATRICLRNLFNVNDCDCDPDADLNDTSEQGPSAPTATIKEDKAPFFQYQETSFTVEAYQKAKGNLSKDIRGIVDQCEAFLRDNKALKTSGSEQAQKNYQYFSQNLKGGVLVPNVYTIFKSKQEAEIFYKRLESNLNACK